MYLYQLERREIDIYHFHKRSLLRSESELRSMNLVDMVKSLTADCQHKCIQVDTHHMNLLYPTAEKNQSYTAEELLSSLGKSSRHHKVKVESSFADSKTQQDKERLACQYSAQK